VTLGTIPPLLVITNPTTSATSKPMIQLKGYSPEPLTSLTFNVTNSQETNTFGEGLVTEQYFDTNLFALTTNWFECLDIGLAQGTNFVSLRATDRAGNVTVTNLVYVFSTNGDTTPPAITLFWPQDGTQISGTNFTLRGLLDDETANLTAQIVGTNGITNIVSGLVERDGKFWAENLPLNPGTNTVTITATDAAGNMSVTNINVFPSSVALTIDCPSTNELWNQTLTVTGTIADSSDYTVWVNGTKATASGTSWTATNVYLPQGGTAVIQARAIANSDNGGNGTGGSGGGPVAYNNLGNPDPPQDNDVEITPNRPPQVYVQSYNLNYSSQITGYTTNIAGIRYTKVNETIAMNWANNNGGTEKYDYFEVLDSRFPTSWTSDDQTTVWPVDVSPPTLGGTQTSIETSGFGGGGTSVTNVGSPSLAWESCTIQGTANYNYAGEAIYPDSYSRKAQTMVRYFTGGKSAPLRENLHQLGVSVHQQTFEPGFEGGGESSGVAITNGVTAGVFGAVGTDGNSWKALPDGQDVDITPTAGSVNNYNFGESAQKYKLYITANGNPLQPDHVVRSGNFCVGQNISFSPLWRPSAPPYVSDIAHWSLPGEFVNDYEEPPINQASGTYFINSDLLADLTTSCWFINKVQAGTASVGMNLQFSNGQTVSIAALGELNVYRPTISNFQPRPPYYAALVPTNSPNELQLGDNNGGGAVSYGLHINSVAPFSGGANIVQLVNASRSLANSYGGYEQTTDSQFWLDSSDPYFSSDSPLNSGTAIPYSNYIPFLDQPGYGLNFPADILTTAFGAFPPNLCSINDSFKDYIVFKPDGANSIYVTLGRIFWSWSASTSQTGGVWSSPTYQVDGPSAPDSSDEFPTWPNTIYGVGTASGE
jgi:Glucodextranase, domain B